MLAAMSPQRAWKRMTPEERLLRTAEAELAVYSEILSPDAKSAHDIRAAKRAAADLLAAPGCVPPRTFGPPPEAMGDGTAARGDAVELACAAAGSGNREVAAGVRNQRWARALAGWDRALGGPVHRNRVVDGPPGQANRATVRLQLWAARRL
jgi:hypothetical protein